LGFLHLPSTGIAQAQMPRRLMRTMDKRIADVLKFSMGTLWDVSELSSSGRFEDVDLA
jgi:hypothetical protein